MAFSAKPGVEGEPTDVNPISPGYLQALKMTLIRGRLFTESDGASAPAVAIVSESAARHFWPGQDPVGQFLYSEPVPMAVVGVVADVRRGSLETPFEPMVYVPQLQTQFVLQDTLAIRTTGDPHAVLPAVRGILKRLDPGQPITDVQTLDAIVSKAMAPRRFMLRLVGLFSVVALCLAALGVYGVLTESVTQRVPEIGVRVALGATRGRIAAMVLSQGAWMVGVGMALGIGGALAFNQVLEGFVFGVTTLDGMTYAMACLAMMAAAVVACWIPARRAATIDPVVALRQA